MRKAGPESPKCPPARFGARQGKQQPTPRSRTSATLETLATSLCLHIAHAAAGGWGFAQPGSLKVCKCAFLIKA